MPPSPADPGGKPADPKLEKAARMLLALGEENAARVLRHMDTPTMEKLMGRILEIRSVGADEARGLIDELNAEIRRRNDSLQGGKEEAHKLLEKAMGKEKADALLEKINRQEIVRRFLEFEEYPVQAMTAVLTRELPQTSAMVLSHLSAPYAAKVLAGLPAEQRVQAAQKIARMKEVSPEAMVAVFATLQKKLEGYESDVVEPHEGTDRLSAILAHMPAESEQAILEDLQTTDAQLVEAIREKLVRFEDLHNLHKNEVRNLFDEIPDNRLWAVALKGAGPELTRHILGVLSVGRAADIMEESRIIGAVPLSEIENNRRYIMKIAENLERDGRLFLNKNREKFVE